MDWLDLQRFITSLIMPLPFGLGLAVVGLVLVWLLRARRAGLLLVSTGLALLGLASSPGVAESLMASLEAAYPPRAAAACRPADAIVVLGGAIQPLVEDDVRPRLRRGSDRVWEAARLYRAGCAPRVVVSAGGPIEPPLRASETEAIASLLADLGVPRSALVMEAQESQYAGQRHLQPGAVETAGSRPGAFGHLRLASAAGGGAVRARGFRGGAGGGGLSVGWDLSRVGMCDSECGGAGGDGVGGEGVLGVLDTVGRRAASLGATLGSPWATPPHAIWPGVVLGCAGLQTRQVSRLVEGAAGLARSRGAERPSHRSHRRDGAPSLC